ncbi:hypothetical protein P7C70_g1370, partial [Phenoliferia sp. Uapishka_3]
EKAGKLPKGARERVRTFYERKWNLEGALDGKSGAEKVELSKVEMEVKEKSEQEVWERIVEDPEFVEVLSKSIGQIVARPTFNQSLKGILSAGPVKSLRYIGPKLRKKWWPKTKALEAPTTPSASS